MTHHHRTILCRKCAPNGTRRGSAIVPALVLVVIVSTLSMIFVQQSLAKNKEQRMSVDSKRAFYMAEAGLSEAFNGLCIGKSGNVGSENEPAQFANGVFFATATEEGQGRVTLTSTGLCGAGRATLSIVVERAPDTIGALGFFGSQSVTVDTGALIDSYNSHAGPYVPLVGGLLGAVLPMSTRVGCNGDITVNSSVLTPSKIFGDVRPGPSGTLFRDVTAIITGATAPSTSSVPFPSIDIPAVQTVGNLATAAAGGQLQSTPGVQGYSQIAVRPSSSLVIVGPAVIVTRALNVYSGAKLAIDATNGPVQLFVVGTMSIDPTATIKTVTNDPLNVSLQVTAPGTLHLAGAARFCGTVYAPNADVKIGSGFEVFGAVTGQSLTIQSGAKLHFDEALAGGDANPDGTPRILGWRIVELPKVDIVSLRYDALKALRDRGVTLIDSKDAHIDIGVTPP